MPRRWEGRRRMIGRPSIRTCLFAAVTSLILAMAASGQERGAEEVLTLDRAIELARANNRLQLRAKFEIDLQREATAEAKTSYCPRFDTDLLATELLTPLDFPFKAGQHVTFLSPCPN